MVRIEPGSKNRIRPNFNVHMKGPPALSSPVFRETKIKSGTGGFNELLAGCGTLFVIGGALLAGYLIWINSVPIIP